MASPARIERTRRQPMLSIRTHTSEKQIGETLRSEIGRLIDHAGRCGARICGPPICIYHDRPGDEDDLELEIAVPVSSCDPEVREGWIRARELPPEEIATWLHEGPLDRIGDAYEKLSREIGALGRKPAGPPRAVFVVGPTETDDPTEYKAELQWPLEP